MSHGSCWIRARTAVIAGVSAVVLALSACGLEREDRGTENEDQDEGVPFGASAEEWADALANIQEPVELVWEIPGGAASHGGELAQESADKAEALSGGKVLVEIAYQFSVSGSLDDMPQALTDGRVDIGGIGPYAQAQEFPLSGTITNDTTMLYPTGHIGGHLAGWGAANEVWWNTPELIQELADHDLTLISPQSAAPRSVMSCREPVTSLDDLSGKQVRVAPITNHRQIEALGATPVSVPFLELYESVQRGIVDCIVSAITVLKVLDGLAEHVLYLVAPVDANFSGTTAMTVAGTSWPDLPLAVQQLMYDLVIENSLKNVQNSTLEGPLSVRAAGASVGGEWLTFDDDVNDALAHFNETTIAQDWRTSPLLDGEDFLQRWNTSVEEWTDLVSDAGITFAKFDEFDEWSNAEIDWDAFTELYYERVAKPNRPSS